MDWTAGVVESPTGEPCVSETADDDVKDDVRDWMCFRNRSFWFYWSLRNSVLNEFPSV
jgi:hypothetical protein